MEKSILRKNQPKWMKIGAVIVFVIILFGLFNLIFGDKSVGKAENYVKQVVTEQFAAADKIDISTKVVAKNETNNVYAIDTKIKVKFSGQQETDQAFILVCVEKDDIYILREYSYDDSNRRDVLEVVYASVARG